MKNRNLLIIISIISLLLISGCTGISGHSIDESTNLVKIGFIGPLTGDLVVSIGEPHQRGLIVGVRDMNNPNIKVLYEDDQGKKDLAISAANKLLLTDNVKILITPLSGVSFALAPIAEDNNVILFSTGANPQISEINENTFRFFIDADTEAKVLAEFVNKNIDIKTFAILYQNEEFGISERDAFRKELEKIGLKPVSQEPYEPGAKEVSTQITKILAKKPDAILFIGFGSSISAGLKTTKELGYQGVLLSDVNGGYPPVPVELREGMYYADFRFDPSDPKINKFIEKFQKEFGNVPVYWNSGFEYAVMQVIDQSINICKDDIECVKRYLQKTEFDTLMGKVKFNDKRSASTDMVVSQIQQGKQVTVYIPE